MRYCEVCSRNDEHSKITVLRKFFFIFFSHVAYLYITHCKESRFSYLAGSHWIFLNSMYTEESIDQKKYYSY